MRARARRLVLVVPAVLVVASLAACSQGAATAGAAGTSTPPSTASPAASATSASTADPAGSASAPATGDAVAGPTTSAPPFATPTSTDVVPAPVDGVIPELPAVAVGETVDAGGGLTAEVLGIEASRITGGVPGDVAGPAVSVTVEVANGGASPADIAFVVVSAAYGDGQEAPGFEGDPADPLVGPIPAGETRRGTYVFGVPEQGAGTLKVRVGTDPARPLAVFTADESVWADR